MESLLGPERSYFVRITPKDETSFDDMVNIIDSILLIKKYFICYETASRPHYHLCLFCHRTPEALRYQLKKYIEGQVYISGKEIQSQVKAIAYCMKDGNWRQRNINILDIMTAKAISKPKENFDTDLEKLTSNETLSLKEIATELVNIYVKYNRKIYRQHLKAHLDLIRSKRCNEYKDNLIKYILDDY